MLVGSVILHRDDKTQLDYQDLNYGDRISALDDSLNDFLTFLEKEFNKEKECAKTSFNWGGAHGSDTSNHVAI